LTLNILITLMMSLAVAAGPAPAADGYDLGRYLSRVREYSKDLKLAAKEKDLAGVQKRAALSAALPHVFAQAGYTRSFTDYFMYADLSALTGGSGEITKFKVNFDNEYSANLVLRQTLFSPGVRSGIKAAEQYKELTEAAFESGESAVFSAAKQLFNQALLLEKVLEVTRDTERNAHDNYLALKAKFEQGVVSQLDLLQAEVRWKNAVPEIDKAARNLETLRNNLKTWAGLPMDQPIELIGDFDDVPEIPGVPDPANILARRPDFQRLVWEEKLNQTNVDVKRAASLPTVTADLIYAFDSLANKFKLDNRNNLVTLGVSVSIPVFTGGYNASQVAQARLQLDKTRLRLEQAKENIRNEVANIQLRLKEARARIASAQVTRDTARKAFEIAEIAARSGITTQLELKDARLGYDQARLHYLAAVFDYLSAYIDWEKAVGEGSVLDE
jgi:outer membrane protein TolC